MRNFIAIGLCALVLTSCNVVNFKEVSLYDVYEEPPVEAEQPQVIYSEGVSTMWNSLENCGDFELTKEDAYSGEYSIKLDWNKEGCEWIGFGNSFSNWAAADMSEMRFKKALSFYVRTQENTAKSVPIVACMEDFGGGGSYHFIDAGVYLDGLEMDTTWKRVIVPLWHFPIIEEEVDIHAIKQMQFQLEGSGSFYLDEITLINYTEEEYAASRVKVEAMLPHGEANQLVYTEGQFMEDAWGYESNDCQELEEITDNNGKHIRWKYASKDCSWANWGMNWNGWYPINVRGIHETSEVSLRIKPLSDAKFTVSLNDFKGHKAEIFNSASQNLKVGEWNDIVVPMESLKLKDKKFVLDQIRQLHFDGKGNGEILIDDIKISGK